MATLPSYVKVFFRDYSRKRDSVLLRTEMESGAPRQAKIRSRPMVTRTAILFLETKADFLSFESWYKNDIDEGAMWFNFYDPVQSATVQGRFVGGGYTARPITAALNQWEVEVSIESWG